MKNKKLLFSIFLVFLFIASCSLTYAYFSVEVYGNDRVKLMLTNTGILEITYNGGPEIKDEEVFPGWSNTKTFTVENTGSLNAFYSLSWENLTNTILNDELVMSASCTGNGCRTITNQVIGNIDGPFAENIEIEPGVIHSYTITFTFLEMSFVQNYNQGKEFSGKIRVEESTAIMAEPARMYGTIVDVDDVPIPFASVSLHSNPQTTTTDENGNFIFEEVDISNHSISVSLDGEELLDDTLLIKNGNSNSVLNRVITKKPNNNEIKVLIKIGDDNNIASIENVHYTLSSSWIETLNYIDEDFENIIAIIVETDIDSPETYTYNEETYDKNQDSVDVSENTDGTVLASTYTDGTNDVIIMINSIGKTSLPQDSSYIFNLFTNLEYLQTENINTSEVTNMSGLFSSVGEYSTNLDLDLKSWDTSNVEDMSFMFEYTGVSVVDFNLDLSSWDISQVTNASSMFEYTGSDAITFNLNLSNWNFDNVSEYSNMFNLMGNNCITINMILRGWDISEITYIYPLFNSIGENAGELNMDLRDWDISQVQNMESMFHSVGRNAEELNIDLSDWDVSQVQSMNSMFYGVGQNATTTLNIKGFDLSSSNTTLAEYAEIFYEMNPSTQIIVGSADSRDWILGLSSDDRPSEWNNSNIIVDTTP